MIRSSATPTVGDFATVPGASLLPWINRCLEGLWLLAVFLVPLMFLGQDYAISEALIAYVEVPKVALLRTLAGIIAVLWLVEWAIHGGAFQGSFPPNSIGALARKLGPSTAVSTLNNWLKVHPSRWLMLAAGIFFGSTLLSTVLSGSFTISMWGEIPGQDGYSAYTIASYGVLFGVVASHLKTGAQLTRLLAAVILMGALVGLYGILQHYGHDFLNTSESTGGGTGRVTIFMGNTIFAAAVLSMTVPITLVAAAMNFHDENRGNQGPLPNLGQLGRDWVLTSLWAFILAVQLLGLMFTFSRGPWSGAVLAAVVFLGLLVLSSYWRMLVRTGLVLGLAGILSVGFLHWQGNVTVVNIGPWLGFVLALLGLAGTFAVLFVIQRFGRAIVFVAVVGAVVVALGASALAPSALSGRGGADSSAGGTGAESTGGQVVERITSIKTDVLGGFTNGRGTHWKVSWKLIKDRPWFEFDDLSLAWLRPMIGYGPDLFRYTYLLESPPDDFRFLPLEPDHAHNFFIHQTVEQGIFGGLSSLALFASVFGVAAHHVLYRRKSASPLYTLLLIGLTAIVLGRFLEMMVGVARISDLTVLWVIFGLFAALPSFANGHQETAGSGVSQPHRNASRSERRRARTSSKPIPFITPLLFRLAVAAWLIGGIGVVTWQKSINSVRASVAEGRALDYFKQGDFESSVSEIDKAIKLAPGVPIYHNNRGQVFLAYQFRPETFTEPGCDQQAEMPYPVCLGIRTLESNLDSVNQQPFNYRSWLGAGNSAFNLQLNDSAVEYYKKAAGMVPNAWGIRNTLAESMIDAGLYDEALSNLDWSLGITGDSPESTRALYLKGRAFQELGRLDEAVETLVHGMTLRTDSSSALASLDLLRSINTELGVSWDIEYFDRLVSQNPESAALIYLRGLAHLTVGNPETAVRDIAASFAMGLKQNEVRVQLAYARLKNGAPAKDIGEIEIAVKEAPRNALINAYMGELQMSAGNYASALGYLENANTLDPELGLAYLIRGKVYLAMGLEESANEVLASPVGLSLLTATDYADRGEIYAFFGNYDLALSDLDQAIRINPNQAEYYNTRGKVYANAGNFQSALADFAAAIRINPNQAKYYFSRGSVHATLTDFQSAVEDFAAAIRIDPTQAEYYDTRGKANATLEDFQSAILDFDAAILIDPNRAAYFNTRGKAHANLGDFQSALADFTAAILIDVERSEYLINRGVVYDILGDKENSLEDFSAAKSLDEVEPPPPEKRNASYFVIAPA